MFATQTSIIQETSSKSDKKRTQSNRRGDLKVKFAVWLFAVIDRCAHKNGGCSPHATCTNTKYGRKCTCNDGYTGNGFTCTGEIWSDLCRYSTVLQSTTLPVNSQSADQLVYLKCCFLTSSAINKV